VHDLNEKEEDVSHRAAKFYTLNLNNYDSGRELNFNF
jgi:8-oxo-dGTP diphosphatase